MFWNKLMDINLLSLAPNYLLNFYQTFWSCSIQWTSGNRTSSSEIPQKTSPAAPRTAQKLKTPRTEVDSVPSPNSASRTPKDRSPKVADHKSSRSPAAEVIESYQLYQWNWIGYIVIYHNSLVNFNFLTILLSWGLCSWYLKMFLVCYCSSFSYHSIKFLSV